MKYIDAATIAEVREAIRQGIPLATIARKLGVSPEELQRLLTQ